MVAPASNLFEIRNLDGDILGREDIVETTLGQAALQRHLAAFETRPS